uniref:Uncharacterized protein n=1 Tax=Oryza brachyantha TaxID=4533 RepID=J3N968_ORYBR
MIHCMADGAGMIQFIKAVADLASGKQDPAVHPVWQRELLMARCPPSSARVSAKLDRVILKRGDMPAMADGGKNGGVKMESQYFIFGPQDISALRDHIVVDPDDGCDDDGDHPDLGRRRRRRSCTTAFELLTAVIWRCRTVALGYAAGQRSRLAFVANAPRKAARVPDGYYGNALVLHVVDAAAGGAVRPRRARARPHGRADTRRQAGDDGRAPAVHRRLHRVAARLRGSADVRPGDVLRVRRHEPRGGQSGPRVGGVGRRRESDAVVAGQ